jgi:hypothetical protein
MPLMTALNRQRFRANACHLGCALTCLASVFSAGGLSQFLDRIEAMS